MTKRFVESKEGLKMLVYGQPGCGKTTLAATACDDERFGRVLLLDAYGNPQALRRKVVKPDILTMERMEDFNEPYRWLEEGQDSKDPFAKEFELKPPYRTIIIDSTTEVQRFITAILNGSLNLEPGNLVSALGRQGFGQLLGTMMHWSRKMVDLTQPPHGLNVVFNCHEVWKQDEQQLFRYEPLIWGQSGLELCGYALLVMRLAVQARVDGNIKAEDETVLADDVFNVGQIRATTQTYAKDQYECGVTHVNNPTMAKIVDLIGWSS